MVNGFLSDPAKVMSGVPQGSVLGPLLFLVISDIDRDVLQSFLSSFADDTRIGRSIKSVEDALELQKDQTLIVSTNGLKTITWISITIKLS